MMAAAVVDDVCPTASLRPTPVDRSGGPGPIASPAFSDQQTTAADLRPGSWFALPDNGRCVYRVVGFPEVVGSWRRVRVAEVEAWGLTRPGRIQHLRRVPVAGAVPLTLPEVLDRLGCVYAVPEAAE